MRHTMEEGTSVAAFGAGDGSHAMSIPRPREQHEMEGAAVAAEGVSEHSLAIRELHAAAGVRLGQQFRVDPAFEGRLAFRVPGIEGLPRCGIPRPPSRERRFRPCG
jgi:hypothetical protein